MRAGGHFLFSLHRLKRNDENVEMPCMQWIHCELIFLTYFSWPNFVLLKLANEIHNVIVPVVTSYTLDHAKVLLTFLHAYRK